MKPKLATFAFDLRDGRTAAVIFNIADRTVTVRTSDGADETRPCRTWRPCVTHAKEILRDRFAKPASGEHEKHRRQNAQPKPLELFRG